MVRQEHPPEARGGIDDAVSVAKALRGEPQAFDRLFQRHYPRVYGLALQLTGNRDAADDIAQVAFVRAHRSLGSLRDPQAFEKYLYRTVVNLVRDRAKTNRRKPWIGLLDLLLGNDEREAEPSSRVPSPADESIRKAMADEIGQKIRALPLEFREAVVLHHLHGMDVRVIGETLGVPEGTVKSRLARGRQRLREELGTWLD